MIYRDVLFGGPVKPSCAEELQPLRLHVHLYTLDGLHLLHVGGKGGEVFYSLLLFFVKQFGITATDLYNREAFSQELFLSICCMIVVLQRTRMWIHHYNAVNLNTGVLNRILEELPTIQISRTIVLLSVNPVFVASWEKHYLRVCKKKKKKVKNKSIGMGFTNFSILTFVNVLNF